MSCGFSEFLDYYPVEMEEAALVPPGISTEDEGSPQELELYTALTGRVKVHAYRQGNRVFCKYTLPIGNKRFQIKVVDCDEHRNVDPMKGYHPWQLRNLKSASVNIQKNAAAAFLALKVYRQIIKMENDISDLKHTDTLLGYHNSSDPAFMDKVQNFCLRYCQTEYKQLQNLTLNQLKNVYAKACKYNAAVDILFHNTEYLNFLYEYFGREGIDDSADYISLVNAPGMDNAFFTPHGFMVFGAGKNAFFPLVSADVGAHEWGHRLNRAICDQKYEKHSGGLNEAFSDMQGKAYEDYIYSKNSGNPEFKGETDWTIGEDLVRDFRVRKLRDMQTPENGKVPQPSVYRGQFWPDVNNLANDHGFVHTTSGPANRLYFLVQQYYKGDSKKTSQLFFSCYTKFHSSSNYIDLRDGLLSLDSSLQPLLDDVGLTAEAVTDETKSAPPKHTLPKHTPKAPVPFPRQHTPAPGRFPFPRQRFPFPRQRIPFPRQRFPFPRQRFPFPGSGNPFPSGGRGY
jgi:hypothetical protein